MTTTSRHSARIAAIQALYAHRQNPDHAIKECVEDIKSLQREQASITPADHAFLMQLAVETSVQKERWDGLIAPRLTSGWTLTRLPMMLHLILQAGCCELALFPEVPYKAVIDEYLTLTRAFGMEKEVPFVNGLLDGVRKEVRIAG